MPASLRRAAARTGEKEFQKLRRVVQVWDARVMALRERQKAGTRVTARMARACSMRAEAMQQLARLAGLMNRRA